MTDPTKEKEKPPTIEERIARVRALNVGLMDTLDVAAQKAIDLQMGGATHAQSWGPLQSELSPQTLRELVRTVYDARELAAVVADLRGLDGAPP